MNSKYIKAAGIFFAAFSVFVWGITFVSTKYLLNDFSAFEIMVFRFIIAYVSFWILRPKNLILENKKDNLLFAMAGLTGVVLYQLTENSAINFTRACNVSIIVALSPLFTALFSRIVLREKCINKYFIIGFILSLTGVVLVSLNGTSGLRLNPKGDILALAASICWGLYSIFVSRINRLQKDSICSTRRIFFYALVFMLPLTVAGVFTRPVSPLHFNPDVEINLQRITIPNLLNLTFLGLVASAVCFILWNKACGIIGTVRASSAIYLIPVVTIIFARIFLGEYMSPMAIIGAILTISGLFVSEKK